MSIKFSADTLLLEAGSRKLLADMTGYMEHEFEWKPLSALVHPEDRAKIGDGAIVRVRNRDFRYGNMLIQKVGGSGLLEMVDIPEAKKEKSKEEKEAEKAEKKVSRKARQQVVVDHANSGDPGPPPPEEE